MSAGPIGMGRLTRAVAVTLVCASCGASHAAEPSGFEPPRVWAPPSLPPSLHPPAQTNAGMRISIVGILMYNDANDCFLLDWGGGFTQPVVWPPGTLEEAAVVGVVVRSEEHTSELKS